MRSVLFIVLLFCCRQLHAQEMPDSVWFEYYGAQHPSEKGKVLKKYFNLKFHGAEEEKLKVLFNTKARFIEEKDETGKVYTDFLINSYFWRTGEYSKSIREGLAILPRFEQLRDTLGMLLTLNGIAIASSDSRNNEQAIQYLNKSLSYAQTLSDQGAIITVLNNIADNYLKSGNPDSALLYIQNAYRAAEAYQRVEAEKEYLMVLVLSTMSDIYIARKEFDTAKHIAQNAVAYSFKDHDTASASYNYSNLAACNYYTANYDSALIFAAQAYRYAMPLYKPEMLKALEWIYKSYESKRMNDSTHKYFMLAMQLKDTMYSLDKTKNIQQMHIAEQLRETEKIHAAEQLAHERSKNIQYTGIFIFILTFIIFVFLLRKKKPNLKIIEYLGMLAVLLLYEFTCLLFHPLFEKITHHNTVGMLICLVILGALIAPLHHKLTVYVKEKVAVRK